MENEKCTVQDLAYGKQTENNVEKETNTVCRTWNMARTLKIMENEKHTLQDVKYNEFQCYGGKNEMLTVGHEFMLRNTQKRGKLEMHM